MSIFKKEKGFTLIELLVVVAIIGILASIILVSVRDARSRGTDAAVKSNLHTTKLEAETFYLNNGSSYGDSFSLGTCPPYSGTGNMFSQNKVIADSIAEAVKNGNDSSCYSSSDDWVVAVGLTSKDKTSWCVDTQGVARLENFIPLEAIDSSTHLCK